ncbi:uncharacterized protein EDB91DRAFT_506254 [Suillus paluster]|uniref:uncharacterized protein n=1 Tax=Suillus paluster TaxID=48578 RepID=UPI001B877A91|nr:uncharacterized protein EDB91DRAFT_506254 [Suillus paluster]KAG1736464.1 hypothetical protein EDB91DRAFT_506254 [Suillus paluster]
MSSLPRGLRSRAFNRPALESVHPRMDRDTNGTIQSYIDVPDWLVRQLWDRVVWDVGICVPRTVSFSSDGTRIVSDSSDKTVWLWDAAMGQPFGEPLREHTDWVSSASFSPDHTTHPTVTQHHHLNHRLKSIHFSSSRRYVPPSWPH